MKYYISEIKYVVNSSLFRLNEDAKDIYNQLEDKGFFMIENFITPERCALLRAELDELSTRDYVWKDAVDSDRRVFAIDRVSDKYKDLFNTPLLTALYKKHIDQYNQHQFIMANRIEFKEGNIGSGGGWHRDSINRRQLKFIMYLNDVNERNGYFQYMPGTHKVSQKLKINRLLGKKLGAYRYTDEDISKLIDAGYQTADFIGKMGTLIIVDTSGIHRGNPLKEGMRYAATQYLSDSSFDAHMTKLFAS
jgi:hypothetical protein